MKFHLNHDPANKTLTIPRAALQLSGLADVSDLILHTDSGCILLLPGDPTVAELLKTISLISAVAPQLISRLAAPVNANPTAPALKFHPVSWRRRGSRPLPRWSPL